MPQTFDDMVRQAARAVEEALQDSKSRQAMRFHLFEEDSNNPMVPWNTSDTDSGNVNLEGNGNTDIGDGDGDSDGDSDTTRGSDSAQKNNYVKGLSLRSNQRKPFSWPQSP
jgi:hypothetical protein